MARRVISQAILKQAVAVVEAHGLSVTLEAPDGTKMTVAPKAAAAETLSPYDAWKQKQRDAHRH